MELTHGSLFSGIGGFDLGFERAGFRSVWQVEIDEYCQRVLARHFPEAARYRDIRTVGMHNLAPVSVITGGFPCQPFSVAGKRRGAADDRYLWPEMLRVIQEVRPRFVVAENVPGIGKMALEQVLSDLESAGYENYRERSGKGRIAPLVIPACAVDAHHRRDRLWIICHTEHPGQSSTEVSGGSAQGNYGSTARTEQASEPQGSGEQYANMDNSAESGLEGSFGEKHERSRVRFTESGWWAAEPNVGRVANGIPRRVDRLKALGNAIVPQIAEFIAHRIREGVREEADGD